MELVFRGANVSAEVETGKNVLGEHIDRIPQDSKCVNVFLSIAQDIGPAAAPFDGIEIENPIEILPCRKRSADCAAFRSKHVRRTVVIFRHHGRHSGNAMARRYQRRFPVFLNGGAQAGRLGMHVPAEADIRIRVGPVVMNVEIIVVASRPRGDDRSSVVILGDRRGYSDFAQLRTVIGKPFAKRIQAEVHPVRRPGLFFQNDAILFAPRLVGSIQRFAQKAIWAVVPDSAIADQLNLIHQRNAEQSGVFRQSHAGVRIFPRENAACEIHHVLPAFPDQTGREFSPQTERFPRIFPGTLSGAIV